MNTNRRNILIEIIASLFILLFVYAALSKLQDFEKFQVELGKSPILNTFSRPISVLIPVLEIIISVMLVIKRFQYFALYLSFSLMVAFSVYIVSILKFSSYIPCSCGGILENMTWTQHLIFNMGFVLLGATAILIYPSRMKNLLQ
ncbi:MauE/DoxX family redox-associated membrane protein [Pedobacter panaciterrae]